MNIAALVLTLLVPAARAETLTLAHLDELAITGIEAVLPADRFPATCFVKYVVHVVNESRPAPLTKDEIDQMIASVHSAADVKKLPQRKLITERRTWGEVLYRVDGQPHQEIVFDQPLVGEDDIQNQIDVTAHFAAIACTDDHVTQTAIGGAPAPEVAP